MWQISRVGIHPIIILLQNDTNMAGVGRTYGGTAALPSPRTAATGHIQDLVFEKFLAINYCTKGFQIVTQPSGYSLQQHQLVMCMGCHIEFFYLHQFSSSAFSSNFAFVVIFSATDVAQIVWDSDSDDGEMERGSDVEIEEHVSSFFL